MNNIVVQNIYNDILELSDIDMQRRRWLGRDAKHISSFTEVYNRLFDDNSFDLFVEHDVLELGFSPDLISSLKILRDKLNRYDQRGTDQEILEDPEWLDIVLYARKVIAIWNDCRLNSVL